MDQVIKQYKESTGKDARVMFLVGYLRVFLDVVPTVQNIQMVQKQGKDNVKHEAY